MLGLELQKRGTGGEHTDAVDFVYDLSNSARLKKTEVIITNCYHIYIKHIYYGYYGIKHTVNGELDIGFIVQTLALSTCIVLQFTPYLDRHIHNIQLFFCAWVPHSLLICKNCLLDCRHIRRKSGPQTLLHSVVGNGPDSVLET